MGFRYYASVDDYKNNKGRKLNVKLIKAVIYAYSRVRPPELELEKCKNFDKLWHSDEEIESKWKEKQAFNYSEVGYLDPFPLEAHPKFMKERANNAEWIINYEKPKLKFKDWSLYWLEKLFGLRIGEYKNYRIIKS
jgi:hypothetical protein